MAAVVSPADGNYSIINKYIQEGIYPLDGGATDGIKGLGFGLASIVDETLE
jgi:hypothetical protein